MSNLRPKGVTVEIGGEELELLFTIGAIEEIQEKTGMGLFDAMQKVASAVDGKTSKDTLMCYKSVLQALTGKDDDFIKRIPWSEYDSLARQVILAFGVSLPEPNDDDEESDDEESDDPKEKAEA